MTTVLSMILLALPVWAGNLETANETVEADGAESLVIEIEFDAGELYIIPRDMDDAAKLKVVYDERRFDYDVDFAKKRDVGHLYLESSTRRSRNIDELDNEWNLELSTRFPTELTLDIGACEAEIDLGGIPLTELSLDIGAASGLIDFSSPNPDRIHEMEVDIGASSVEIINLGNANVDRFEFSCGAASCELDFRGEFNGETEVRLDVGLGSTKIILPEDVAVRIETEDDNWFSSIDFHNDDLDEVRDGVFESPGYRRADNKILVEVDVGMGSVDFYFK